MRLRAAAILLVLACWATPAFASQEEPTVADSVVRITVQGVNEEAMSYTGSCSGFVVAPERVLTAAHCKGDTLTADKLPAKIIRADDYYDLMLLEVKDLKRPALTIRDTPAQYDEQVLAYGFGFGWAKLTVMHNRVMLAANRVDPQGPVGVIVQGGFIGGMSGGPVVDENGEVVAMVQKGNAPIGYGVGVLMLKVFLYDAGDGE